MTGRMGVEWRGSDPNWIVLATRLETRINELSGPTPAQARIERWSAGLEARLTGKQDAQDACRHKSLAPLCGSRFRVLSFRLMHKPTSHSSRQGVYRRWLYSTREYFRRTKSSVRRCRPMSGTN